MFKVICSFADIHDNGHVYHEGDIYPRDGVKATIERQKELLSSKNKIGKPLIEEEVKEEPKPKKPKTNK